MHLAARCGLNAAKLYQQPDALKKATDARNYKNFSPCLHGKYVLRLISQISTDIFLSVEVCVICGHLYLESLLLFRYVCIFRV